MISLCYCNSLSLLLSYHISCSFLFFIHTKDTPAAKPMHLPGVFRVQSITAVSCSLKCQLALLNCKISYGTHTIDIFAFHYIISLLISELFFSTEIFSKKRKILVFNRYLVGDLAKEFMAPELQKY